MKNKTMKRCNPYRVHTSIVKKSAATISSQCRVRNSFHVVLRPRSGAGSMPCRSRIAAIVLCNLVAQIAQGALDAPIAPVPVLFGHSDHQGLDHAGSARSPWFAIATTVILQRNQLPMPSQERLGRDNRGDLRQKLPAETFGLSGQSTAVVVIKPQSSLTNLFAKNPVLLAKVIDHQ